ncbi:MAG: glutamine amidotransferase [Wenzhouxiangellaceae bacterium]|nr:glutamine amidotransferase [Wenzhouxiangellaceae bacterium]
MKNPVILIIKTGSAVPAAREDGHDFDLWFPRGLGRQRFDYQTISVSEGQALPALDTGRANGFDAVLVTGSPAMVTQRLDWSERSAQWLARVHDQGLPIIGVCYGHQLLAHALGGRVGPNPRGRHMGRVMVDVVDAEDRLMRPFAPRVPFNVSHSEIVIEPPDEARTIACADHDPHHGLHFGGMTWGVQFHPEFDADIMKTYIEARADALHAEGHDPGALAGQVEPDTPGHDFLQHFGDLVIEHFQATT